MGLLAFRLFLRPGETQGKWKVKLSQIVYFQIYTSNEVEKWEKKPQKNIMRK